MVHFKVTDGVQTRRLEAPSGLSFKELKKKLSSMFPEAVKKDSDLVLHYRDAEGDVISLSSNQELQEALNSAGGTGLKFHLTKAAANRTRQNWSPWSSFEKEVQGAGRSEEDHPQSTSEASNTGDEGKSKETLESVSSKKDCHCEGHSLIEGLAPFLLSNLLFHPPAPRRVGYNIRYTPYCSVFC